MTALRYSAASAGESIVPRRHLRKFLIGRVGRPRHPWWARSAVRMWRYSQRHVYDPIYMSYEAAEDIPYIQKPNFMEVRTRGLAVINSDRFVATGWGYSTFEGKRDRRTN